MVKNARFIKKSYLRDFLVLVLGGLLLVLGVLLVVAGVTVGFVSTGVVGAVVIGSGTASITSTAGVIGVVVSTTVVVLIWLSLLRGCPTNFGLNINLLFLPIISSFGSINSC